MTNKISKIADYYNLKYGFDKIAEDEEIAEVDVLNPEDEEDKASLVALRFLEGLSPDEMVQGRTAGEVARQLRNSLEFRKKLRDEQNINRGLGGRRRYKARD